MACRPALIPMRGFTSSGQRQRLGGYAFEVCRLSAEVLGGEHHVRALRSRNNDARCREAFLHSDGTNQSACWAVPRQSDPNGTGTLWLLKLRGRRCTTTFHEER